MAPEDLTNVKLSAQRRNEAATRVLADTTWVHFPLQLSWRLPATQERRNASDMFMLARCGRAGDLRKSRGLRPSPLAVCLTQARAIDLSHYHVKEVTAATGDHLADAIRKESSDEPMCSCEGQASERLEAHAALARTGIRSAACSRLGIFSWNGTSRAFADRQVGVLKRNAASQ